MNKEEERFAEFLLKQDGEFTKQINKTKDYLVEMLMRDVQKKEGVLFNEDGAYQMAMYVVRDIDVFEALEEYYKDELAEWFKEDEEMERNYLDERYDWRD